jgi:hypothetical protein
VIAIEKDPPKARVCELREGLSFITSPMKRGHSLVEGIPYVYDKNLEHTLKARGAL